MIPLGKSAAAGLPSSSATSASTCATAPFSAYTSHSSTPSSSAASATARNVSAGVLLACQNTDVSQAFEAASSRSLSSSSTIVTQPVAVERRQ